MGRGRGRRSAKSDLQEYAASLQARKLEFVVDQLWCRDEHGAESDTPLMRSELDIEAYELAPGRGAKVLPRLPTAPFMRK